MNITFLANAAMGGGFENFAMDRSWWQTLGALAVVFGLLMLFLRLLKGLNRGGAPLGTTLLAVWHLGPKREIQVLRLGDMVHYIYRHDGSMVVLKEETFAAFELQRQNEGSAAPSQPGLKDLFGGKVPFVGSRATT